MTLLRLVAQNVNLLLVVGGFVSLESGLAVGWSGSVAAVVGGVLVMAAGAWPYVRKRKP
jgi:hypothetical protein